MIVPIASVSVWNRLLLEGEKWKKWKLVQIIWFITSLVAVSHHFGEIIHGQQGHSSAGDTKAKMHSRGFCLRCFEAINLILLCTVVAIEEVWANSNIRIANTASFAQDPTPPFVMFNRPSFLRTLCKPWCSTQLPSQSKLFSSIGIVTDNGEKVRRNLRRQYTSVFDVKYIFTLI